MWTLLMHVSLFNISYVKCELYLGYKFYTGSNCVN